MVLAVKYIFSTAKTTANLPLLIIFRELAVVLALVKLFYSRTIVITSGSNIGSTTATPLPNSEYQSRRFHRHIFQGLAVVLAVVIIFLSNIEIADFAAFP